MRRDINAACRKLKILLGAFPTQNLYLKDFMSSLNSFLIDKKRGFSPRIPVGTVISDLIAKKSKT